MLKSPLKIYRGPEEDVPQEETSSTITLSLAEALPLLADAILNNRTWLEDFEHDEITLSTDLYEVLQAYRFLNRPAG